MNPFELIGPQLAILIGAAGILIYDAVVPRKTQYLPWLALASIVASAVWAVSIAVQGDYQSGFEGTYSLDKFSVFFSMVFAGIAAIVVLASIDWIDRVGRRKSEYYALLLTATAGLMFLAGARDLITIFIALELSSIPQYILAGWGKDEQSGESGVKYLLLGAIASSLLLFGMALLYGLSGTTFLPEIATFVGENASSNRSLLILSSMLILAGFAFKMALVPFQMWVPDVYQGAPTPVAAFLSVGSKAAAFAVVLRIFFEGLNAEILSNDWAMIFAILAAASMTIGNIFAAAQSNIKRMLGYSSVAQAGNFAVGLAAIAVVGQEFTLAASAILFFVVAYAFTNLAAFIAVIAISRHLESDDINSYEGIAKSAPLVALALAIALISLSGIPPSVGFWAKLYVFNAAAQADLAWLVIIAVLNSVLAAFYYLRIVRLMFRDGGDRIGSKPFSSAKPLSISLGITVLGVLVFGFFPTPVISVAREAAAIFSIG
jgi:NADH-quinone oxidoreductase subunit N